jgi:16S rRNA (cytosine1402-N4)-methyltransferase
VNAGAHLWTHTTVLLAEAVEALLHAPDGLYVDGTFGRGGHARAILARLSPRGRLIAFDKDAQAIQAGAALAQADAAQRLQLIHASFAGMRQLLAQHGVTQVQGVLLDLGVSSPQLDDPARGFSFRFDAPLDMRMDTSRGETAADFLARADERQLTQVIRDYGEERFAVQVAKALVARRQGGAGIRTTGELAEVVAGAVKTREPGQNPATRTFQALRIHVNAELEELEQGLSEALELLAPQGRLVVISFHSLEDRIVKSFIARESRDEPDRRAPFAPPRPSRLRALGRIRAGAAEVAANARARSAVMRVAERTAVPYAALDDAPGRAKFRRSPSGGRTPQGGGPGGPRV